MTINRKMTRNISGEFLDPRTTRAPSTPRDMMYCSLALTFSQEVDTEVSLDRRTEASKVEITGPVTFSRSCGRVAGPRDDPLKLFAATE